MPLTTPGLIYGVGHAVYSQSDPRAEIFKAFVHQLAAEEGHGGRVSALRLRGATGSPDHQRRAQDVQGCQRQRGLLLRLRLSDAGHPGGAVHPPVCHRPHRRLERPPAGGTGQQATASSAPPTRPFCLGGSTRKLRRDKMQQTLHGLRANQKERVEFLDTLRRVFRSENASFFTT